MTPIIFAELIALSTPYATRLYNPLDSNESFSVVFLNEAWVRLTPYPMRSTPTFTTLTPAEFDTVGYLQEG